ncbi:MAG: acyl-CoA dehydrogenase [Betaproteobacteria bacterium]|nr:acyl-CoA dehydrogenase [Betaproteobacteria bacterium]
MDFSISTGLAADMARVDSFVNDRLIPLEQDPASFDAHENIREELLQTLRQEVKAMGLFSPQMPRDRGGLGLTPVGQALLYERMNRSLFGPVCFNCAAPDDGNMTVLSKVATEAQKQRWLDPIIRGDVRSSFVMTEPHPGGGSDPGMIQTWAERKSDRWVVHGRKWFITGAEAASHYILIAKTGEGMRDGLTAFAFHRSDPGWQIVRRIPIMGPEEHGGHCELVFNGLEIPDENRLMAVGQGLKLTQIRLGLARLTHCMRWLGLAQRCMEIASQYVATREGFGIKLIDRESVQIQLGRVAMAIDTGRLLTMRAAWRLEQGGKARPDISMAKIAVADTLHLAADTAIQLCGARGYSTDTPLEWIYRYARQARLVDGATEVHQMVISQAYRRHGQAFFVWGPGND